MTSAPHPIDFEAFVQAAGDAIIAATPRTLSIAFTVALLFSEQAKVRAIAAIARDETARWQEERALRRRVDELEQKSKAAKNDK